MKKNLFLTALFLSPFFSINITYANAPSRNCEQIFQQAEALIVEAEKQPGTHSQVAKIKSQFENSKQLILALEKKTQLESCELVLQKINHLLK